MQEVDHESSLYRLTKALLHRLLLEASLLLPHKPSVPLSRTIQSAAREPAVLGTMEGVGWAISYDRVR